MALVDKSKAATLARVSRSTIYAKINSGQLSSSGGKLDTSELIRVFGEIHDDSTKSDTPLQSDAEIISDLQAKSLKVHNQLGIRIAQLNGLAKEKAAIEKERNAWQLMAETGIENVKLITHQKNEASKANITPTQLLYTGGVALLIGFGLAMLTK